MYGSVFTVKVFLEKQRKSIMSLTSSNFFPSSGFRNECVGDKKQRSVSISVCFARTLVSVFPSSPLFFMRVSTFSPFSRAKGMNSKEFERTIYFLYLLVKIASFTVSLDSYHFRSFELEKKLALFR